MLGLDLAVKQMVVNGFDRDLWFLRVHLVENRGLIFSLPVSDSFILVLLSLALLGVMWLTIHWWRDQWRSAGALIIVLGALSNAIDRIRLGYVVDWIDFGRYWPIMNGADIVILVGLALILWRQSLNRPSALTTRS